MVCLDVHNKTHVVAGDGCMRCGMVACMIQKNNNYCSLFDLSTCHNHGAIRLIHEQNTHAFN